MEVSCHLSELLDGYSGAILCIALAIYNLSKENIEVELETKTTAHILIACGILTTISSLAVWNSTFKTLPIAPFFFIAFGYLLLKAEKADKNAT